MSKIANMTVGAIDPIAVTKRVFWRPTDTTIVLAVGDAVCYRLDLADHKKRTANPVNSHLGGAGTAYAEGVQSATGRLFVVEEPLIDNIDNFAGIVKSLGPEDGADGDMIEIFKANSGAVVPANLAGSITTVVGRTLLAVVVGQRTLGCPVKDIPDYGSSAGTTDSKIVGVAMEVRTTIGKCWVKLDENMFVHQGGNLGNEFVVPAVADDVTINQINVEFKNTQDHCLLLHYRAKLTGTGDVHASRGIFRFDAFLNHTGGASHIYGIDVLMDIGSGVTTPYFAPLKATLRSRDANPDLSGTHCVACLFLEYILTKTGPAALTNPPPNGTLIYANSDDAGTQPVYFLFADKNGTVALTDDTVEAADNAAKSILVKIGGIEYHIPCYTDTEIT